MVKNIIAGVIKIPSGFGVRQLACIEVEAMYFDCH